MPLKKIHSSRDPMEAHFLRNLLENEGIAAVVMGESLGNAVGALPVGEASPTVWVNEKDVARAKQVVAKLEQQGPRAAAGPLWKCPQCGEVIEGQFTQCWNCQTPRPGSDEPAGAVDAGPVDPMLHADASCIGCGYNLRGLTPANRCPECGLPILRSLLNALYNGMPAEGDELQRVVEQPFASSAAIIGHPAAALIMIAHAWMQTMQPINPADSEVEPEPAANAGRICAAVRDIAIDYFGGVEEARAGLRTWQIHGSDEIGKIISGLMTVGLIEGAGQELFDSFKGLCRLDEMFL